MDTTATPLAAATPLIATTSATAASSSSSIHASDQGGAAPLQIKPPLYSAVNPEQFRLEFPASLTSVLPTEIKEKALKFIQFVRTFKCPDTVYDGTHYAQPRWITVRYGDKVTEFMFYAWVGGDLDAKDFANILSYSGAIVANWSVGNYPLPNQDMSTRSMCVSISVMSTSLVNTWTPDVKDEISVPEVKRQDKKRWWQTVFE